MRASYCQIRGHRVAGRNRWFSPHVRNLASGMTKPARKSLASPGLIDAGHPISRKLEVKLPFFDSEWNLDEVWCLPIHDFLRQMKPDEGLLAWLWAK